MLTYFWVLPSFFIACGLVASSSTTLFSRLYQGKPVNMILYWHSRCNFYFCLCHKLALWPWASHQISLTHINISQRGYGKALITGDDYYMHKSSSSFLSLFSSLAISLSFQIWSRKLSGNTPNRHHFCGKTQTTFTVTPSSPAQGYPPSCCKSSFAAVRRAGGTRTCWGCSSWCSLQYQVMQSKEETDKNLLSRAYNSNRQCGEGKEKCRRNNSDLANHAY